MTTDPRIEDLLRRHAPQVLGALVRRYGHFDAAEDAVQEALLAAAVQWPAEGRPENPRGWLIRVASRRLTDQLRSDSARRRREEADAALAPPDALVAPPPGEDAAPSDDDTLSLLFLCCHPELTPSAQVALTLRAVGGLTTAEIARAHLVPEATMAQRINRAKQRIRASGAHFRTPPEAERQDRLAVVLQVLYLIFNEGYTATSGTELLRDDLAAEAVRLTRLLRSLLPEDGEVAGLLALMLLTDARRAARTGPSGELVPLAEQDRARWDTAQIEEGTALVEYALRHTRPGPYQVQAAIAALHDEAADAETTDWPQILALYDALDRIWPSPVVRLNHAVAVAMVRGPEFGLALLDTLRDDPYLARGHRLAAARGHLLDMAGDREAARAAYRDAARRTLSDPERRYLLVRAARLA
ncbi:sigma-70 family RNA polymerase sigma factor [Streptomyces sp. RKND-216]|uniref:RNA polymerase sigma factor n=1 Tax=Streptomyces sp. RKND-216 TaxID=2562581 RepID=UPI00109DA2A4|nr:sigma-70 family RNA polymerase sigma factor [Streptomyces sp. RKND-216]THA23834.1 sigma-70 family RNA polymerase sigma factor [Streptomyces sp. RKND-216]